MLTAVFTSQNQYPTRVFYSLIYTSAVVWLLKCTEYNQFLWNSSHFSQLPFFGYTVFGFVLSWKLVRKSSGNFGAVVYGLATGIGATYLHSIALDASNTRHTLFYLQGILMCSVAIKGITMLMEEIVTEAKPEPKKKPSENKVISVTGVKLVFIFACIAGMIYWGITQEAKTMVEIIIMSVFALSVIIFTLAKTGAIAELGFLVIVFSTLYALGNSGLEHLEFLTRYISPSMIYLFILIHTCSIFTAVLLWNERYGIRAMFGLATYFSLLVVAAFMEFERYPWERFPAEWYWPIIVLACSVAVTYFSIKRTEYLGIKVFYTLVNAFTATVALASSINDANWTPIVTYVVFLTAITVGSSACGKKVDEKVASASVA